MYVYLKAVIGICNISSTVEKQKREHPGANPPTLLAFTDFRRTFPGQAGSRWLAQCRAPGHDVRSLSRSVTKVVPGRRRRRRVPTHAAQCRSGVSSRGLMSLMDGRFHARSHSSTQNVLTCPPRSAVPFKAAYTFSHC